VDTAVFKKGDVEAAEEIPTVAAYYDGSVGLNIVEVHCEKFPTIEDCVKQGVCGTYLSLTPPINFIKAGAMRTPDNALTGTPRAHQR